MSDDTAPRLNVPVGRILERRFCASILLTRKLLSPPAYRYSESS
jgi:hypothetical protein